MTYQPIENYGIIGNMRTAALVSSEGSIDWYCYPRFDSPSLFAALLDDRRGGRFEIAVAPGARYTRKQLYWPDTNILITRFLTADGIVEVQDLMPVGLPRDSIWHRALMRRVRMVRGTVRLRLLCQPAFDYARRKPETRICPTGALFLTEKLKMALASDGIPLGPTADGGVQAEFLLAEGDEKVFIFHEATDGEACFRSPGASEAHELFLKTVAYWRRWLASCTYRGRWRENVLRSALTLKLLSYEPSGALIAAPTCSLPEVVGGTRNWDYRYTWLRDAAFTVYGLLRVGFNREAESFMQWVQRTVAEVDPEMPMQIVYGIEGDLDLTEKTLDHLEGYLGSRPVRIGNAAYTQRQMDIYGELMDAIYLTNKYVSPTSYDSWRVIRNRMDWICRHWRDPDRGIWEARGADQHYVYSKLMCWVALDRAVRLAGKRSFPAGADRWVSVRDEIYEEILARGWNPEIQAFTQSYESTCLDASSLIMPLVFFMAPSDPRMLKTIDAINRSPKQGGLVSDGLVYRYDPTKLHDGLTGDEGTFNMCSFWLVEALTRAGQVDRMRLEEARLLFERMLGYSNHLGLYAEETSPEGRAIGNFPQAFTHMALISAAFNLDRALSGARS